jgi:DNA-binding SARP family transcriptional activator/Tfp pilus assembly protein PilF
MDGAPQSFADQLRTYRVVAELSQEELARRSGMSVRALRDLEHGRVHRPRPSSVDRLAAALCLSGDCDRRLREAAVEVNGQGGGLWIGVLGPLTVHYQDSPVELSQGKQRWLLGMLAVEPNRPWPPDHIADLLWDGHPPRTWPDLLRTYVARLRGQLRPALRSRPGTELVSWSQGGYLLHADSGCLDLMRFDQLATGGYEASDPCHAFDLYARALRCWHGPVLADLDFRLQQHPAVVAVTRRRLEAAIAFADLALDLGRFQQAEAAMQSLARAEPLHEGVHARLVLALAGSGRRAAALELFASFRRRLADELGIGPGEELLAAHQRVVREEPSSTVALNGSAAPERPDPVPRQLPMVSGTFVGRTAQLAALNRLADQAVQTGDVSPVAVIDGMAGMGKTTLAGYWLGQVTARFPDGQLCANLRGFDAIAPPVPPTEVLRGFIEALGVPSDQLPAGQDALVALYRSLLVGRRMLVFLDNACDADQVRPLLPGSRTCLVVVTSRHRLTGLVAAEGAQMITLDLLAATDARELLIRHLGQERVTAEPTAVRDLIGYAAGLPLALALIAARAAVNPQFTLAALADELADHRRRLDALDVGDPATQARTVFARSYQALTADARRLFRMLGLHPGPDITLAATASMAGRTTDRMRPLLAELSQGHLLTEPAPGRYACHDLLRAYAEELSSAEDPEHDRHRTRQRIVEHYLLTAHQASRLLYAHRRPIETGPIQPGVRPEKLADCERALSWLTTEQPVLLSAAVMSARSGLDHHSWQLAWLLSPYLHYRACWSGQEIVLRTALAATRRLGDPAAQAYVHRTLGLACAQLDRHDEAHRHYEQAVRLYRSAGDEVGEASAHLNLTWALDRQGRPAEALSQARRANDLFRRAGHRVGEASAFNTIGWYLAELGDHQQALAHCQRALRLHEELDNRHGQAATLDSLGNVYHRLGRYDRAVECYRLAVGLSRQLGRRTDEAMTLVRLGDAEHAVGRTDAGFDAWQGAVEILELLGHPEAGRTRAKLRTAAHR